MNEHDLMEHERRVEGALMRAAERLHEQVVFRTPADEVMLAEEAGAFVSEEERRWEIMADFLSRFFDFVFAEGPHPGWVLRRLYALARIYRPDLMLRMNGTDLALLFGETRAAQSFRLKCLFDELGIVEWAGVSKRRAASRTFSAAQRGNRNRRKGMRSNPAPAEGA